MVQIIVTTEILTIVVEDKVLTNRIDFGFEVLCIELHLILRDFNTVFTFNTFNRTINVNLDKRIMFSSIFTALISNLSK